MFPPSSLKRRLAASVYEALPILAIIMVVGLVFVGVAHAVGNSDVRLARPARIGLFCSWYCALAAYFVWSWRRGQTLAMKAWRLRLEAADQSRLSLHAISLRFVLASVAWGLAIGAVVWLRESPGSVLAWSAVAPLVVGLAWALWDRDHQALYDRLAGTRLAVYARNTPTSN